MGEIVVKVPEGLPLIHLKKKIDDLVKEEGLRWALMERCKADLGLESEDLERLEQIREEVWLREKKRYVL